MKTINIVPPSVSILGNHNVIWNKHVMADSHVMEGRWAKGRKKRDGAQEAALRKGHFFLRRLQGEGFARQREGKSSPRRKRKGTKAPRQEHTCLISGPGPVDQGLRGRGREQRGEAGQIGRGSLHPVPVGPSMNLHFLLGAVDNHRIHSASEDADCDHRQERGTAKGPVGVVNGSCPSSSRIFNIEVLQVNLDTSVVRIFHSLIR